MPGPQHPTLAPRLVPRAGVPMPPVVWEVAPGGLAGPSHPAVIRACIERGADWFYLPASTDLPALEQFARLPPPPAAPRVLLGLHAEHLLPRGSPAARQRVHAVGRQHCAALLLEDVASVELKGGRVFQRMAQLRDEGLVKVLALNAADVASAEWMVEHTPAHAVCVPYGLADQTARYGLLTTAEELGTAILARRPPRAAWSSERSITSDADVRFRVAESGVTSLVEPLPSSFLELEAVWHALSDPMPDPARGEWWTEYQKHVPAPAKPRGGHPPEFGA